MKASYDIVDVAGPRGSNPAGLWLPLLLTLAGLPFVLHLASYNLPGRDLYIRAINGELEGYLGMDFVDTWIGAKLAVTGAVAPLFNLAAFQKILQGFFGADFPFFFWSYPPHLLPLILPLGFLPYVPAFIAWTAGTLAGFLAAALPDRGSPARWPTAIALLLAPSTIVNGFSGQNGFATAGLLVGGLRLLDRRPIIAGALFGILTIKPHLGLVLPFVLIALRAWTAIASAIAAAGLLVGLSVVVYGLDPWRGFFLLISPFQWRYSTGMDGTFASMVASVYGAAYQLGAGLEASLALQAVAAVPALAAALWVLRRSEDASARILAVVAAVFLSTPYVMYYDLTSLTAALALYLGRPRSLGAVGFTTVALAWVAAPLTRIVDLVGLPIIPLVIASVLMLVVRQAVARVPPGGGVGDVDLVRDA
ncbi:MAG: DUF2029 domain-containing protein [Methylobacteriaceae bacterium]|nr:DUF2029 domain-containing protein [Methylobacteriaceae bacterium]